MATSFAALESFYWVAHLKSFSGAAERLNVTQPTVSYRIKELEERLGVSLFVRRGRTFTLTSEGEALRSYAEQMIGVVQDIEANIKATGLGARTLRVGVMDSFASLCLPSLINELEDKFTNTRIAATVDNSHSLANKLSEGLLDVAVLSTPPDYANVKLQLLGRQSVDWIASPSLGLGTEVISGRDLLKQRIFSTPAPSNLHQIILGAFSGPHDIGLKLNVCNSISVIRTLVQKGVGISLLPTRLVQEDIDAGTLTALNIGTRLSMQDVYIGTNKGVINRALPRVVQLIQKASLEVAFCT